MKTQDCSALKTSNKKLLLCTGQLLDKTENNWDEWASDKKNCKSIKF